MVVHVMTAYDRCTASDTQSTSGFDACFAAAPADPVCRFATHGRGKVSLAVTSEDVRVLGVVYGVDAACEGQRLDLRLSLRVTTNDCPPGASPGDTCTLVDLVDASMGECQISAGICRLNTTLNSRIPGLIQENSRTHLRVEGCSFVRTTGTALPTSTFDCGIMVP